MSSAKIKNIYVLENHADNTALRFAGVRGGSFCRVRIYALLFLNHIHIHIQIHIHSANGLQNLHLHTFLLKFFAGLLRTKNNELRVTKKKNGVYSAMCGGCVVRAEMR